MADSSSATGVDNSAIYHEVSPYTIVALRGFNVCILIMIVISVAFCIVNAEENRGNYLLLANLALSGLITVVVNWWYRSGDLGADKYWFIFLLGSIVLLQCVTTDIYAFHTPPTSASGLNTPITMKTTPFKPISWATINTSTLLPPTTHARQGGGYFPWF